jgi:diaminopimelate decarboxylase
VSMPELDLGGGFGIAYTTQDDPSQPLQLAREMSEIVQHECRALGIGQPRLSIEPGRAIVGPAMCTVYTVGTVKRVELDGGAVRTYVSVDGGMSDNIRTALYDADYSCTLASRSS